MIYTDRQRSKFELEDDPENPKRAFSFLYLCANVNTHTHTKHSKDTFCLFYHILFQNDTLRKISKMEEEAFV